MKCEYDFFFLRQTGDNVIDGTPCSYDHPSDVCVQGKCVRLGCDKILGSPAVEDACGICGGDGTKCEYRHRVFKGEATGGGGNKLIVLPRGARNIAVRVKQGKVSRMAKVATRETS